MSPILSPMPAPARTAIAFALVVVLALTACGTSGRAMREPERDVPSPTRSVPTTLAPVSLPPLPLGTDNPGTFPPAQPGVYDISSSAFEPGGELPEPYTCGGPSPALRWQGIPEGTTELALVVTEPEDGGDVHWIVTDLAPDSEGIGEGEVPAEGIQLENSLGESAWTAPCPPPGEPASLNFVLLALTQPASVPSGSTATDVYRLLSEQAAGKTAVLTTTIIIG